jgi:hypothetical protein
MPLPPEGWCETDSQQPFRRYDGRFVRRFLSKGGTVLLPPCDGVVANLEGCSIWEHPSGGLDEVVFCHKNFKDPREIESNN